MPNISYFSAPFFEMKKQLFLLLFFLVTFISSYSTHNRAGEITYKHLKNLTYEITITTYTDPNYTSADRCTLDVNFGDGSTAVVYRVNGPNTICTQISQAYDGEIIAPNVKKNIYKTTHTYAGPGVYDISMGDPNRVFDIRNIPNSGNIPFYIKSQLVISAAAGHNSSPVLEIEPVDAACLNKPFYHNPGAIDPDGDSLVYDFSVCFGENGIPISGYLFPNQVNPGSNNQLSINKTTGLVSWLFPPTLGDFNLCIIISEYRRDSLSGVVIKVGEVLRDMQIAVQPCDNDPPVFDPLPPVCVVAGDSLKQKIVARDDQDNIELTAVGLAFKPEYGPAVFKQPVVMLDSVKENLYWQTHCNYVRKMPYQFTFRAEDSRGNASLTNFADLLVTVVAPPSISYNAVAQGNAIKLNWSSNPCENAIGYNIYRRVDSSGYAFSNCITGVPASAGFTKIDFIEGHLSTSYIDNNKNEGLNHGQWYCYLITAVFKDGAESYPTAEFCERLNKDVPVIYRISVNQTNETTGSDTIAWAKPTELDDTVQFLGPYLYRVFRSEGIGLPEELVTEIGPKANLNDLDTIFENQNLNTKNTQYHFRVQLISGTDDVGSTKLAPSPFLNLFPGDQQMFLQLDVNVPWTNNTFEIYRYNNDSARFILIDTAYSNTYLDTGLINGKSYCYKIKTIGSYSVSGFANPIINFSQENCAIPRDTISPCPPPNPFIEASCDLDETYLTWENPNNSCADDVEYYKIYFTNVLGGNFELIETTTNASETELIRENLKSLAGCYAITAIDSSGNESKFSNRVCVDNCPLYRLPNIFTPGGDGLNDFFHPFPYKYVESIDIKIYNRWGELVFETTNPDIAWDGTDMNTKKVLSSGVYFYVCTVNEIRLRGIEPRILKGNVTIQNQKSKIPVTN